MQDSVGEGWRVDMQLRSPQQRSRIAGDIWEVRVNFLNSKLQMKEASVFILFYSGGLFCSNGRVCCSQANPCQLKLQQWDYWMIYSQSPDSVVMLQFHNHEAKTSLVSIKDDSADPFCLIRLLTLQTTCFNVVLISNLCHFCFSDVVLKWFKIYCNSQKQNRRALTKMVSETVGQMRWVYCEGLLLQTCEA